LGQEAALEILKARMVHMLQEHGDKVSNMRGDWAENLLSFGFTVYGMAVSGKLVVGHEQVQVEGTLPLAAVFFRGQVEQTLRTELQKLLV
jgi:hypothetical protein